MNSIRARMMKPYEPRLSSNSCINRCKSGCECWSITKTDWTAVSLVMLRFLCWLLSIRNLKLFMWSMTVAVNWSTSWSVMKPLTSFLIKEKKESGLKMKIWSDLHCWVTNDELQWNVRWIERSILFVLDDLVQCISSAQHIRNYSLVCSLSVR